MQLGVLGCQQVLSGLFRAEYVCAQVSKAAKYSGLRGLNTHQMGVAPDD